MSKNKPTKLYRIYRFKLNSEKEMIASEPTKIVFLDVNEVDAYCQYLNNDRCLTDDKVHYSWAAEEVTIVKKAKDLIEDANEDVVLFS